MLREIALPRSSIAGFYLKTVAELKQSGSGYVYFPSRREIRMLKRLQLLARSVIIDYPGKPPLSM